MPHISHLTIRNFRKFDHLEIDLTDPAGEPVKYFVLAGPNGCGKTTVLEAIYTLPYPVEANPQRGIQAEPAPPWRAAVSINTSFSSEFSISVSCGSESQGNYIEVSRSGGNGHLRYGPGLSSLQALSKTNGQSILIRYLRSRRDYDSPDAKDWARSERIVRFSTALKNQLTRRVPGYRGPEPKDVEWTERLNTFWRRFRNDGTELVMTLVNPDDLDQNDWDLFLYKGNERICSVGELSSGEQEVIAMAVPFITEPFDGILLIDEPELHLHPEWQARLMRALRALIPEAQIIVATHSDELWDDARSWERLLLVPPDDPRASSNAPVHDSAE